MKNILVIEDWQPIARAIKAQLEAAGNQVTWLTGATAHQTTDGGVILTGLTASGQTEEVDCRKFQVAFVDGQLEGNIHGPALTALLVQSGVACCGMSTAQSLNKEMLDRGARLAYQKPVILAALLSKKMSPATVQSPTTTAKSKLAFLEARFLTPTFADLLALTEAYLAPYMAEEKI